MNTTWINLGGTSTVALCFARRAATRWEGVLAAGHDSADMQAEATDCRVHEAPVAEAIAFDTRDSDSFTPIIERAKALDGSISVAVFAGSMPAQDEIDADPSLIAGTIHDSFTGPATFLTALAPEMETRGAGIVVGVGSVAVDRGRLGNCVNGAAKAGFHTYLAGLRNRFGRSGVHVVTIKPGTDETAITWVWDKLPFLEQPEKVVADIFKAVDKKKNTLYTPIIWRSVMTVIKLIPERILERIAI